MSTVAPGERFLTAVDTLCPEPGEIVHVLEGSVLVFAQDEADRRIPLTQVDAGGCVVGCLPAHGAHLLLTGLPGTRVRQSELGDDVPIALLAGWLDRIGLAAGHDEFPRSLVRLNDLPDLPEPGTHVVGENSEAHGIAFVQVTDGTAHWCGHSDADVVPEDPPFPLPSSSWLTLDEGCRVARVSAPSASSKWAGPLALAGHSAIACVLQDKADRDHESGHRLEQADVVSAAAVEESIDALASSIGAALRIPTLGDMHASGEFGAAVLVALSSGLTATDDTLQRAVREIETGRHPIEAVADACGARPRRVTLESGWREREGRGLIVKVREDAHGADAHGSDPHGADAHGEAHVHDAALTWRRGWQLIDPATRQHRPVTDAVAEAILPDATELVPVLPPVEVGMARASRLAFSASARDVRIIAITTLLLAGLAFFTPYLTGQIANLFTSHAPTSAYYGLFLAIGLVILTTALWQTLRAIALLRTRSRALSITSGAFIDRMIRLPASWHARVPLGKRMSQVNAPFSASQSMPDDTVARFLDVIAVVGSIAAILTVSGSLAVAVLGVVGVQILASLWLARTSSRRAATRIETSSVAAGWLLELLRGVNRIRIAGAEDRVFLRWALVQARSSRADQQLRVATMIQAVLIAVWPGIGLAVIIIMSSLTGASFAGFLTAQTAMAICIATVASASVAANSALIARESLRSAEPLLAAVPEGGGMGAPPGLISGGLEVRDLVFRYAPDLPPVLDHVSLTIRPGEHLAIVGPSGCGKSTLLRILLGLQEAESGSILVDGKDLASLDRPAVRRQIGSVLQSSQLLSGTIRSNLDMGRGLTTAQLVDALARASMEDDVAAMALGLDTPVSDGGGTVSGGQRQRLLIARALAGKPRMLVFDEATSALDNITQAAVVDALERLRLTRIVVAHRLSTIRHADRIIVMDAGRIVDSGTYEELVERPGPFRELAVRQQA